MKALPRNRALSELFSATLFWGFGYVATVWAIEIVTAVELTFLRFLVGGLFTLFFVRSFKMEPQKFYRLLRLSFWPGLFMAIFLTTQTVGLKYTTAVNSTFITSLYVVITPFFEWAFLKQKSHPIFLAYAGLSLFGVGFIVQSSFEAQWSPLSWIGDGLTLITAIFCAAHLIYVGQVWNRIHRPFLFNALQCLWAGLFLLPLLIGEIWLNGGSALSSLLTSDSQVSFKAALGFFSVVFGSTVLAFFLQIRAQSVLSASVTSLVCLLEAPLGLLFALWLLDQPFNQWSLIGAFLIFASAVGATWTDSKIRRKGLS